MAVTKHRVVKIAVGGQPILHRVVAAIVVASRKDPDPVRWLGSFEVRYQPGLPDPTRTVGSEMIFADGSRGVIAVESQTSKLGYLQGTRPAALRASSSRR